MHAPKNIAPCSNGVKPKQPGVRIAIERTAENVSAGSGACFRVKGRVTRPRNGETSWLSRS